jgi:hypothetical protein
MREYSFKEEQIECYYRHLNGPTSEPYFGYDLTINLYGLTKDECDQLKKIVRELTEKDG